MSVFLINILIHACAYLSNVKEQSCLYYLISLIVTQLVVSHSTTGCRYGIVFNCFPSPHSYVEHRLAASCV